MSICIPYIRVYISKLRSPKANKFYILQQLPDIHVCASYVAAAHMLLWIFQTSSVNCRVTAASCTTWHTMLQYHMSLNEMHRRRQLQGTPGATCRSGSCYHDTHAVRYLQEAHHRIAAQQVTMWYPVNNAPASTLTTSLLMLTASVTKP
jgi:hypothetical protein